MTTLDESMFDTEHGYEAQDPGPTVVRDGDVVDVGDAAGVGGGGGGVSPAGRGGRRRGGTRQAGAEAGTGVSGEAGAVGGSVPVEESAVRMAPSRWIRETTFREKLRGYHQADVDSFLDQVA